MPVPISGELMIQLHWSAVTVELAVTAKTLPVMVMMDPAVPPLRIRPPALVKLLIVSVRPAPAAAELFSIML